MLPVLDLRISLKDCLNQASCSDWNDYPYPYSGPNDFDTRNLQSTASSGYAVIDSLTQECGLGSSNYIYDLMSCMTYNNMASKRNLLPVPRAGKRSEGLLPMPRTGRSGSSSSSSSSSEQQEEQQGSGLGVVPMPRPGRSSPTGVLPFPRAGRSGDASGLLPMPRVGRSDSASGVVPFPRAGRSQASHGGDASGLLPMPRVGRSIKSSQGFKSCSDSTLSPVVCQLKWYEQGNHGNNNQKDHENKIPKLHKLVSRIRRSVNISSSHTSSQKPQIESDPKTSPSSGKRVARQIIPLPRVGKRINKVVYHRIPSSMNVKETEQLPFYFTGQEERNTNDGSDDRRSEGVGDDYSSSSNSHPVVVIVTNDVEDSNASGDIDDGHVDTYPLPDEKVEDNISDDDALIFVLPSKASATFPSKKFARKQRISSSAKRKWMIMKRQHGKNEV